MGLARAFHTVLSGVHLCSALCHELRGGSGPNVWPVEMRKLISTADTQRARVCVRLMAGWQICCVSVKAVRD